MPVGRDRAQSQCHRQHALVRLLQRGRHQLRRPAPPSLQGCGGPSGTCFVGPWKIGWETLHGDYWQTWQEAASNNNQLDQNNGSDFSSDVGTFGDLVEDCANDGVKCKPSFINSTTPSPSQVYGPSPGVSPPP
jgi:hypothetical protein